VDNDAFTEDESRVGDSGVAAESDDVFNDTLHKVISDSST
jgi:hypothetical protein